MPTVGCQHIFPKRIYSPVGGWVLTMFLLLLECSYIGSLCYELSVQHQSPTGRVLDAPWMALIATPPAMVFVTLVGTVPATIGYIVLRASSLKRRLTVLNRLWIGAVFGTITASMVCALPGVAPHFAQAAPVVAGFVISSTTVMMTISVRWLGVDPSKDGNATR